MAGQSKAKAQQSSPREPHVKTADVAALAGVAPVPPATPKPAKPFLSEGMRNDLETVGWAVDPVSGARFEINRETGEVTLAEKPTMGEDGMVVQGKVSTVDVAVRVPPATVDPDTGETSTIDPDTGEILTIDADTGVVTARHPQTGETRIVNPD